LKKTWFDRAVEFISPTAAFHRYQSRIKAEIILRHYEAASHGRRTSGWNSNGLDVNNEIARAKRPVRERARDLTRNNPFAVSVLDGLTANVIGTGIETIFRNADGTPNKKLTDAFKAWAESTDADQCQSTTYHGIQELVFRSIVEGGEALVLPIIESSPVPRFCLKALEPDFIDDNRIGVHRVTTALYEMIVDGILIDKDGKKKGYYLWSAHPGSQSTIGQNIFVSNLVDASSVFHIFKAERIGQLRGISWFAPVMTMLKELDELFDATLLKQKIASAFAGFIVDYEGVSTGLTAAKEYQLRETIESGALEVMPPGKDIKFPNPPAAGDFDPFTRSILRAFSCGMKVPYEVVTGDLSNVNFSSGRMGWQEFGRKIDQWQWNMLVPMLCQPVANRWLQFQGVMGARTGGVYATFVMPKRAMVDPVSETNAINSQIRMGTMSLPDAIRAQGEDPEEKIKEIADFNELLDQYGLVFDSDPRKITKSGILQADPSAKNSGQDSGAAADGKDAPPSSANA